MLGGWTRDRLLTVVRSLRRTSALRAFQTLDRDRFDLISWVVAPADADTAERQLAVLNEPIQGVRPTTEDCQGHRARDPIAVASRHRAHGGRPQKRKKARQNTAPIALRP
jgi:hypothetical protein